MTAVHFLNLLPDLLSIFLGQIGWVKVSVVADLVPFKDNPTGNFREFLNPFAYQEEGRLNPVSL